MVFSSSLFLLYFLPLFLVIYHIVPKYLKNWCILIFSIFFYSWGAPKFVFILIGSTIVDFYLVKYLFENKSRLKKQLLLTISITINVGLLIYFKYFNFFIDNLNFILDSIGIQSFKWFNIILPIGISFYTFQTLTYSIDVYKGIHKPLSKLSDYLLYIMSFPQMIAGPIVRFNEVADQIIERNERIDDKLQGIFRFCIGLGKKVLIANILGEQADIILNTSPELISTPDAWIGIIAYTFQIYFDFSGYSDMAIGLGKIMGFNFPENFNNPYISSNITEFWRRWHITLGRWMRDYLYIPLGGNKVSQKRLFFNLWFIFVISGLWHGASWNFVIWGAYHGFFLILDRLFLIKILEKVGKLPSIIFTFLIVVVGWIFFRIENFSNAMLFISKLIQITDLKLSIELSNLFFISLVAAFIFSFLNITTIGYKFENILFYPKDFTFKSLVLKSITGFIIFSISLAFITSTGFNPFIYFRF